MVFREFDVDNDGCFTEDEMFGLLSHLLMKEKPKTIDDVKKAIVSNLKKKGELKKKGPAKNFKSGNIDY
jgi:hypothetical protein